MNIVYLNIYIGAGYPWYQLIYIRQLYILNGYIYILKGAGYPWYQRAEAPSHRFYESQVH